MDEHDAAVSDARRAERELALAYQRKRERVLLGTLPDGSSLHMGDGEADGGSRGGLLLIRWDMVTRDGWTYLHDIIYQCCRGGRATHVIDLTGHDYGWLLEGPRSLSTTPFQAMSTLELVLAESWGQAVEDEPDVWPDQGLAVIVNGADRLYGADDDESALAVDILNEVIASARDGVLVILIGRNLDVADLPASALDASRRILLGSRYFPERKAFLRDEAARMICPGRLAVYEGAFGSPSFIFRPGEMPDVGNGPWDWLLELPVGSTGATLSTMRAQHLLVHGGTAKERSQLVASMALSGKQAGVTSWVATASPDSPASADWRNHRDGIATGPLQALEMLRHISDEVLQRLAACRAADVRTFRDLPPALGMCKPVLLGIDDLEALIGYHQGDTEAVREARNAAATLIGFVAQTAEQSGIALVIAMETGILGELQGSRELRANSARLLFGPSTPEARQAAFGTNLLPTEVPAHAVLFQAAAGTPVVALNTKNETRTCANGPETSSGSRTGEAVSFPF